MRRVDGPVRRIAAAAPPPPGLRWGRILFALFALTELAVAQLYFISAFILPRMGEFWSLMNVMATIGGALALVQLIVGVVARTLGGRR